MTSILGTTAMDLALDPPVTAFAPGLMLATAITTAATADAALGIGFLATRTTGQMLATELISHNVDNRQKSTTARGFFPEAITGRVIRARAALGHLLDGAEPSARVPLPERIMQNRV